MSLDQFPTALEIKQVSDQRIISGHAAAWALDRVGDVIDQKAFDRSLAEKTPSDVAVLIGHNSAELPVGIPLVIRPDEKGLYTEVRVFDGPAGDNLLAVARGLKAHGQTLGLSIGYRVRDSKLERVGGQFIRKLLDIDLVEFSYAARQAIANPQALMTGVKSLAEYSRAELQAAVDAKAMDSGSMPDMGGMGDHMPYEVRKRGDQFCVHNQQTGRQIACHPTEAAAMAQMRALYANEPAAGGSKAVWSTSYVNDLPDSAFLYVEDGGAKDDEGKTVPRSLRHFPYKDDSGSVDEAHLRNAISRIPQASGLSDELKARLQARARRVLDGLHGGKTVELGAAEWEQGAAIEVSAVGYALTDVAETIAAELKAMALLGSDTKGNGRLRAELRERLSGLAGELTRIVEHAELIDREQDGAAKVAHYRRTLELLEV